MSNGAKNTNAAYIKPPSLPIVRAGILRPIFAAGMSRQAYCRSSATAVAASAAAICPPRESPLSTISATAVAAKNAENASSAKKNRRPSDITDAIFSELYAQNFAAPESSFFPEASFFRFEKRRDAIASAIAAPAAPPAAAKAATNRHIISCQTEAIRYLANFRSSSMQRAFCSGFPIVMRSHSGSP